MRSASEVRDERAVWVLPNFDLDILAVDAQVEEVGGEPRDSELVLSVEVRNLPAHDEWKSGGKVILTELEKNSNFLSSSLLDSLRLTSIGNVFMLAISLREVWPLAKDPLRSAETSLMC